LEIVEKNLSKLADTDNVDRLVEAVKKMKKINKEIKVRLLVKQLEFYRYFLPNKESKSHMTFSKKPSQQRNLQARIAQDIITTVLRSDRDGNLVLSEGEMFRLIFRLKNSPRYEFNEEKFKIVIGNKDHADGYSIVKIMKVIRNLLDDNTPTKENIFKLKPEKNMKFH